MVLKNLSVMKLLFKLGFFAIVLSITAVTFISCGGDDPNTEPTETDYTDLLTNQINGIIIPAMTNYQTAITSLLSATNIFSATPNQDNLTTLRDAYKAAYLAYQVAAVHNFYATANQSLVANTNLYPIDQTVLTDLIENESYNFNNSSHQRANGFPALDYMLYGSDDIVTYFTSDAKRLTFMTKLVESMKERADAMVNSWNGSLKDNFIGNGGTALGSSISVQLNESIIYYEDHIRENKVGIPIGLLGPNDTPITPDATKIEAYYQSLVDGDDRFALSLVRAAVQEVEKYYLGGTGQGYDDLLLVKDQSAINNDIKAAFTAIYNEIDSRTKISGDDVLYQRVQALITVFKSDLFPVLNVQDADGGTDGD